MPRFEVQSIPRKIHPIQFIIYILGIALPVYSTWLMLSDSSFGITLLFVFSIVLLVYTLGRIYGEVTIGQDYVEIVGQQLSFRSTPAFGMGWLPIKKTVNFDQIRHVDIVNVTPTYDPNSQFTALELVINDFNTYIIGNNLSNEQIMKIGLTLKGTVSLSRGLTRLITAVEDGEYGDQVKDLINMGKSIWNSIRGDDKEPRRD